MTKSTTRSLARAKSRILGVMKVLGLAGDTRQRTHLLFILMFIVLGGALSGLAPVALKYLVNDSEQSLGGNHMMRGVALLGAYIGALTLARMATEVRAFLFYRLEQHTHRYIRATAVDQSLHLSVPDLATYGPGRLTQIVNNGTRGASRLLQSLIAGLGPIIVQFVTIAIVLAVNGNATLFLAFSVSAVGYGLVFSKGTRRLTAQQDAAVQAELEFNGLLTESLAHPETLKLSTSEMFWEERLKALAHKVWSIWRVYYLRRFQNNAQIIGVYLASLCLIAGVVLWQWYHGTASLGDVVLVIIYMTEVVRPLEIVGHAYRDAHQGAAMLNGLMEIMDLAREGEPRDHQDPTDANEGPANIRLKDVYFSYRPDRPILEGIQFSVEPGSKVALVGRSGSGKSTVARLLGRIHVPDSGAIQVAGRDWGRWPLADARRCVCVVPQDIGLFAGTIEDNIRVGLVDVPRSAWDAALEASGVMDLLKTMPDGSQTQVGSGGAKLSGGQRQRISIARALLRCPRVLVLDEATSAMDAESESLIMQNIDRVFSGVTRVIVSHRLYAVRDADRIMFLEGGVIIENGRHDDLIAADGQYAKQWHLQNSGQRKEGSGAPVCQEFGKNRQAKHGIIER